MAPERKPDPKDGYPLKLDAADPRPLLDRLSEPLLIVADGEVLHANLALCRHLDRDLAQLQATPVGDLFHPLDRERVIARLEGEQLDARSSARWSCRMPTRGGEYAWVDTRCIPAEWHDREVTALFCRPRGNHMLDDAAQERLRQTHQLEAVGRLAGGIAHDVNNLLGAIMGFTSVLQVELEPEDPRREDTEQVLAACRKGRNLMLNLLGFARRGKYRRSAFEVNDVVVDVLELLKHSVPKKIVLRKQLAENLGPVEGDASQIHHALMNVCLNAVDAMGEVGTLTLRTVGERFDEIDDIPFPDLSPGSYVRVEVADTGRGMDQGVADKAFEPFFTTKSTGEGAGMGLSMVYGTVVNHGGAVVLESAPGEGTTVALLLPTVRTPSDAFRTTRGQRRPSSEPGLATVLLVDDEQLVRAATRRLLTKLGYKVLLAADGREALRTYVDHRTEISCVMLDLVMPVMDGAETFHQLREIDPQIPILLASGFSKEEKADELIAAGADGFVQKPFDLDTLRQHLSRLIG